MRAPRYTKQKLIELKGEISSSILIVGDLHTPLSIMDTTTRQKVNKKLRTGIIL